MFRPPDALKPRDAAFDEGWHAQTLALADTMVQSGYFSAQDWAETLGAALKEANAKGETDTTETYYLCAVEALEKLLDQETLISQAALARRKSAWHAAYLATPHGQVVELQKG